ncbi:MAG: hypothetical protein VST67_10970 [Nitrospirota bacterium]|nr:hypothetical protein [Nitrospirota bacterium]
MNLFHPLKCGLFKSLSTFSGLPDLQMVHELQTHLLPAKAEELAKCAIRMGYRLGETAKQTAEYLLVDYRGYTQKVPHLYQQIVKAC